MTGDHSASLAVVGMSGRFPGASTIEAFWTNLREGREGVTFFTDEELIAAGVQREALKSTNYVKASGVLRDIELFDAGFFGFNPRDAEIMDPQHRLFLECVWESLEDAGYDPERYPGLIGVYAGTTMSTYAFQLYNNPRLAGIASDFQVLLGNDKDHLSTRVSYKLNLRGPSVTLGTACSTSLVAVCMACQSLLDYHCDMALAGGVTIQVPQVRGYFYEEGGIGSPDGHCRTFDAQAQGTVGGNGVGVVLLKRLEDALQDRDHIYAVIRGYGLNNDGAAKVGYTAPSVDGQASAIALALAMADVTPDTITYVEAHGTATPLGDPIEIAALKQAFRRNGGRRNYCAIGSLKSAVGHLDSAAGVAGLIKTALALHHKEIPPSLHFTAPNPKIDFDNSPFYVNTQAREWTCAGPRRAGVSSFGIGGTNAHVVLEEAPPVEPSGPSRPFQILAVSARSGSALQRASERLASWIESHPGVPLADVACTLLAGRKALPLRRFLVCPTEGAAEAARALSLGDPRSVITSTRDSKPRQVAFLFPGQGSQHANMGRGLYESEPRFRAEIDACCALLEPLLKLDLREVMYPAPGREAAAQELLRRTAIAQPAIFVTSWALAQLWIYWGLSPVALLGHSIGEYVAACLSGVFSLEGALNLVCERGRLMEAQPRGAMLAVSLSEQEALHYTDSEIALAAVNAPSLSVLAGSEERIGALERTLGAAGVHSTRLHTSHAFHSALMQGAVEPLSEVAAKIPARTPRIPYLSNLTGAWIRNEEAGNAKYWGHHLRNTVRFAAGLQELLRDPDVILLECGPGQTLATLTRQFPSRNPSQVVLSSLRHPNEKTPDSQHLHHTAGRLWLHGARMNWERFYDSERRRRVPLPTYPFERQRYWIEPELEAPKMTAATELLSLERQEVTSWFYVPAWQRMRHVPGEPAPGATWLVLAASDALSEEVLAQLRAAESDAVIVDAGANYAALGNDRYSVRPGEDDDFARLFADLAARARLPRYVLHLWTVAAGTSFEDTQRRGFLSVAALARELTRHQADSSVDVAVVASGLHRVLAGDPIEPDKATLLGVCRAIPQEFPHLRLRSIDASVAANGSLKPTGTRIISEVTSAARETVLAIRNGQRWALWFDSAPLEPGSAQTILREGGVYLITGGLGGIGMLFASHLAKRYKARLVLVGRTANSERIERAQQIETAGAKVLVRQADVADEASMREVIDEAKRVFGRIDGVFHGAGVTSGDAFVGVTELRKEHCERHFHPKIHGLRVLDKLFAAEPPDFFLLLSSLSSILGGLGFCAYASANLFMDAFAASRSGRSAARWITVNWDGWLPNPTPEQREAAASEMVILPEEGAEALERILADPALAQVVVSTGMLEARLEQWATLAPPPAPMRVDTQPAGPAEVHERPNLEIAFEAPRGEEERTIAGIWQDLLGIDRIGIHDNFFELGGHSLLAIQVVSRLRQAFHREVPVRALFDHPTVARLAENLAQAGPDGASEQDAVHRLLERVERLSDAEVQSMLRSDQTA